jgi:hypothetical protein
MNIEFDPDVHGPAEVLLALKDQIKPERWKRGLATKEAQLNILQTLQNLPGSHNPITIGSALSLLQEFKIISNPNGLAIIDLVKRLLPNNPLTTHGFVKLLLSVAEINPKLTDEQRSTVRGVTTRLSEIPDRPMRTDEFTYVCAAMIKMVPEKSSD